MEDEELAKLVTDHHYLSSSCGYPMRDCWQSRPAQNPVELWKGNPSHPLHTKENHVGLLMFCLGLFFFFLFNVELGKKPQYQGLIHSFQVLCEARACIICDCLTGCSKTSRKRHSINEKSSFSEAGDFFFFLSGSFWLIYTVHTCLLHQKWKTGLRKSMMWGNNYDYNSNRIFCDNMKLSVLREKITF